MNEKSKFQKEIEANAKRLNEIYDRLLPNGLPKEKN